MKRDLGTSFITTRMIDSNPALLPSESRRHATGVTNVIPKVSPEGKNYNRHQDIDPAIPVINMILYVFCLTYIDERNYIFTIDSNMITVWMGYISKMGSVYPHVVSVVSAMISMLK